MPSKPPVSRAPPASSLPTLNATGAPQLLTLGATDTLDPRDGDLLDAVDVLLGGRGVDAAIEAVGTRETAEHAYAVLAPGGTAVIIGMMPPQDYLRIPAADLRHGRTLTGSVMGEVRTHHDIPRYISLAQGRALDSDHLATAHYPLDDVNVALDHARARTGIRTMITF
ncbi:zinc-binding dehydrogenase [Yinghuangia aomiensis]